RTGASQSHRIERTAPVSWSAAAIRVLDGHSRRELTMAATRPTILATVLALALRTYAGTSAEPTGQVTAVAPEDVRWFTPSYYTDGRQRAQLRGDSSKGGAWIDRVKIPGGSRILAHTHPDDEVVTVIEGTWYLGIGEKFDA